MKNMKKYIATFLAIVMLMGIFTVVPTVSAYDNPTVKISDEIKENNGDVPKDDNQKDDGQKDDSQKDDNQDENNSSVSETTVSTTATTTNTSETSTTKPKKVFKVSVTLVNMTCSNSTAEITENDTYTNIIEPLEGFTIKSVNVVMNNKEIQPKIENDICTINIQNVSYDISILAVAKKITNQPVTTPTSETTIPTSTTSATEPTTATVPTTEPTPTTSTTEPTNATVPTTEPTTATVPTIEPTVPGPICSVNSTNNCATSQTVTLTLNNTTKYYWGTRENPDENDFENVTATVVEKKVSKEGTYYLVAKNEKRLLKVKRTFYKTDLNANGGKVNTKCIITESGKNLTLPKPTKKNFVFSGWTLGSNTKKKYSKVKVISNKTYKALWISPKITLKIQNKTVVKDGYKKFISYNKDGIVSDWYKNSVNCNEKAVWRPSNAKSRKVLTIKNDTKKGIVTFTLNKKAVSTQFYQVDCLVSGKKVFSMQLYFSDLEKLYNVKITRNNKKTVSLSWKKTTNSQKYLVTVKDKNTKKTVYKTLSLKAKSYKYTKLNPRHKYSVSVRLCYTIHGITYYGDAKTKTI